jgi:hypothetical protein
VAAVQACLEASVGGANTTRRGQCARCYYQRESEALEQYRTRPTLHCKLLNDNVCTAVTMCPCLQSCEGPMSALADCKVRASFERVGVNLTCPRMACRGTNVSFSNDDPAYGYCGHEGVQVRTCVEAATLAPYSNCTRCLRDAPGGLNLTNATTCRDLSEAHCVRRVACPCVVEECRHAFTASANCSVQMYAIEYPHLSRCVLDAAQCSSPAGGGGGAAAAPPTSQSSSPAQAPTPPSPGQQHSSGGQGSGGTSGPSSAAAAPASFLLSSLLRRPGAGATKATALVGALLAAVTGAAAAAAIHG